MFGPGASTQKVTRAVTGVIPFVLSGCVVFSAYVVIAKICYGYFANQGWNATSHGVTAVLAVLLLLMGLSYTRLYLMIQTNPGLVPLPAPRDASSASGRRRRVVGDDLDGPYDVTVIGTQHRQANDVGDPEVQLNEVPGLRHDCPGLEAFYGMDAFVCDGYGHPRFCTQCRTWKPDRAHHSAEIGRCVRKMDHFCPWVGGMVGETSFKFFTQFVFYATLSCALCLAVSATTLAGQVRLFGGQGVDAQVCVAAGLAGFFGLFSFMMSATTLRFILLNTTNVDHIDYSKKVYRLAISVHPREASYKTSTFASMVVYPLHKNSFRPQREARDTGGNDDETDYERFQRYKVEEEAAQQPQPYDATNTAGNAVNNQQLASPPVPAPPKRVFAVVTTRPGENPWDRGYAANFRSVMGDGPLDWLVPIRQSPCVSEWSNEGFYRFGPLIEELRARHRLPRPDEPLSEKQSLLP